MLTTYSWLNLSRRWKFMIKVFLREKKLLHSKLGLYLDLYPAVINPDTGKQTRREHLKLYVFAKPKDQLQRDHNKETRMLAEAIRAKRQLEFQAGAYGFGARRITVRILLVHRFPMHSQT